MDNSKIETLIRLLVQPLVKHPQAVQILFERQGNHYSVTLIIHPDDMATVIGQDGEIRDALRTLILSAMDEGQTRHFRFIISNVSVSDTPAP